jgi:hypothetical protein
MKNNNMDKQLKKNQPKKKESGNPSFPQEYEEQISSDIHMKPQPLVKPKKS